MNIEDLRKIKDMAIANADRIVLFAKENKDRSALLQAHGALAFAGSIIAHERLDMIINKMHEQVKEINEMEELLYKKMENIWDSNI